MFGHLWVRPLSQREHRRLVPQPAGKGACGKRHAGVAHGVAGIGEDTPWRAAVDLVTQLAGTFPGE